MVWTPQRSDWPGECSGGFGRAVLALAASQDAVVLWPIHAAAGSDARSHPCCHSFTGCHKFCLCSAACLLPREPPGAQSTLHLLRFLGWGGWACLVGCMLPMGRPAGGSVPRGCGGFKSPAFFGPGFGHLLFKGASVLSVLLRGRCP